MSKSKPAQNERKPAGQARADNKTRPNTKIGEKKGRVLTPDELKKPSKKTKSVKRPVQSRKQGIGVSTETSGPKSEAPAKGRGRPSKFTPELAREICMRIAAGASVRSICEDEAMPSEATVRAWAVDDLDGFSAQYTRAIQIRAMGWADEIVDISDDGRNDTYIDDNGNERTDNERVARSRLRVDTRKWMLSKMLPKVYGDTLDVNHGVQPDNPLASLIQRVAGSGLPIKGKDE